MAGADLRIPMNPRGVGREGPRGGDEGISISKGISHTP